MNISEIFSPRMFATIARGLRTLLITRVRLLGVVILTVGFVVAALLAWQLFILEPAVPAAIPVVPSKRLSTDAIDRLEFWIEEVDAERKTGFLFPDRPLFVVDDLPQEPTP